MALYRFKKLLIEGIHDQGNFKLVFMAGGTGNGKDFVLKKSMSGLPLKEINSDHAFAYLMKKKGLDLKMPEEEAEAREPLRQTAKGMTKARTKALLNGRNGVIVNGTGDDVDKIKLMKSEFEKHGYDTSMVFVHSSNEVSRQRNIQRGQSGDRQVPENIRSEKWGEAAKNLDHYKKVFGDNFHLVDASKDAFGSPEDRADREGQHMETFRKLKNWVESPSRLQAARDWYHYNSELRGLDSKEIERHKFAKLTPHERRITNPPKDLSQPSQNNMDHGMAGFGEKPKGGPQYDKMGSYSLGVRKLHGDKKAESLLNAKYQEKRNKLK
jgi:hypothetical protein